MHHCLTPDTISKNYVTLAFVLTQQLNLLHNAVKIYHSTSTSSAVLVCEHCQSAKRLLEVDEVNN